MLSTYPVRSSERGFLSLPLLLLFTLIFSISPVSAVPEGYSCGYKGDGSPFCDYGLACNFFQCVDTGNPSCSDLGGEYCSGSLTCDGGRYENSMEGGWCCIGGSGCTSDEIPGQDCKMGGETCYIDSQCCGGYECNSFECDFIEPENPQNAHGCEEQGGNICGSNQLCQDWAYIPAGDTDYCCWKECTGYQFEGEPCTKTLQCYGDLSCNDGVCTEKYCSDSIAKNGYRYCERGSDNYFIECEDGLIPGGKLLKKKVFCEDGKICSDDNCQRCDKWDLSCQVGKGVADVMGSVGGVAGETVAGFFQGLGIPLYFWIILGLIALAVFLRLMGVL